jgi:hypothetical protein
MNRNSWTVVLVFGLVALLVFVVGVSLLGGWGYGGWGRMGPGMMGGGGGTGPGMMGGWGLTPFGWLGMIFMWLIPVGLIVLVVLGIAWLVQAIGGAGVPPTLARACPNCGRAAQADWRTCPCCGQALS